MLEQRLLDAHQLLESERYDEGLAAVEAILEDYPNHSGALNMAGFCWLELGKDATAFQFFQRALQTQPDNKYVLVNSGRALHELGKYREALAFFLKAAEIDPGYAMAYSNAAASLVQMSKWEDGRKAAELALECDPDDMNSRMNLANCYIAMGELEKGWESFELSLGSKFRREWAYGDEERWNGEKGKTIVIYGEQGLGDEIYFMESANHAIGDSKKVYVDCDPKLEGLFKRSFPNAEVHGTRRDDAVEWLEGVEIEARCAMGSLSKFYRNNKESYPREPYLVACPERRKMWRALFDSYKKPVVGICSVGGTKKNNQSGRTVSDEKFKSLVERYPDVVFVSLDYKGSDPGFCKAFPFAARSSDYDDTAALIAELDCVVGICTTAMHCADALGTPAITLVPDEHNWKFSGAIPYMKTSTVIHQNGRDWADVLKEIRLDI